MHYDTDGTRRHPVQVVPDVVGPACCGADFADDIHKPGTGDVKAATGKRRPGTMPDDSYPINNANDLANAINAYGRGLGDSPADKRRKAAIKRHIMARAKALSLTDKLPDDWKTGPNTGNGTGSAAATSKPNNSQTSISGSKEAPKVDARQRKPRRNDFVEWVDAQGKVSGKVEKLVTSGKVPDVDTAGGAGDVEGTPGDPAVRIRLYRKDPEGEWQETEVAVARKLSGLRKIDPLVKDSKQIAVEQEWRRRTGGQFAQVRGPLGRRAIPPAGFAIADPPPGIQQERKLAPGAVQAETGVPDGAILGDEGDGVLDVIVSVTGVCDDVDDIIEPGAYEKTLQDRTPKVLADHDWNRKVGRCESIEELLPGDPRLPKTTPNGQPWPAAAGALIAKVRFNLETDEGRQAYSECKFYGSDPKSGAQFSIGYNVPPGESWKDGSGVRHIKRLDLYEVSSVLWGAHPLTGLVPAQEAKTLDDQPMTLETKRLPIEMQTKAPKAAADEAPSSAPGDIVNSAPSFGEDFGDYENDLTQDPSEWPTPHFPVWDGTEDGEGIGCRCGADETDPEAHGIDLSGDLDPAELADLHSAMADDVHSEVDRFLSMAVKRHSDRTAAETKAAAKTCRYCTKPATHRVSDSKSDKSILVHDGHRQMAEKAIRRQGGSPVTKPIGESKVAGVEASPGDVASTEKLRLYWVHGAGAAKIRWGEPNDWKRCVRELGKHLGDRAKGYCTLRHHEALGVWPGQEDPHHSHSGRGGKAAETAETKTGLHSFNPQLHPRDHGKFAPGEGGHDDARASHDEQRSAIESIRARHAAGEKTKTTSELQDHLSQKHGVDLQLSGGSHQDDPLVVHKIVVPADKRDSGKGTAALHDITAHADEKGVPVALTPSGDFGGSKTRLDGFYRRFGFVPNKGRNKDFSTRESMIRQPVDGHLVNHHKSAEAAVTEEKSLMSGRTWFPGSMEALQASIEDAIEDAYTTEDENTGSGLARAGWVNVFATFDDHVYATVYGPGHDDGDTYSISYTATPDGDGDYTVVLGEGQEIEIVGVAVPDNDDDDEPSSAAPGAPAGGGPSGTDPLTGKDAEDAVEGETKDTAPVVEARDLSDTPEGKALASAALLAISG